MLAESDFVNVREPNRGEDHYSYIKILTRRLTVKYANSVVKDDGKSDAQELASARIADCLIESVRDIDKDDKRLNLDTAIELANAVVEADKGDWKNLIAIFFKEGKDLIEGGRGDDFNVESNVLGRTLINLSRSI
ncbi:hypothetical protein A2Z22_04595 [Candidatus Woesebacteria bacterium RBG_16_34_12]|uniref:Uncharacterized protein n=1 Tax=Candidatus Woesebacteria bacterium RBG_16_34_12 TaxID=1802480 RepID=A0A1F7XBK8_9BACT|nr:MAG: hypothetical protein A2Z22_04595 [Candidatus Woesebacteria bacterium RBG_16_34_12]